MENVGDHVWVGKNAVYRHHGRDEMWEGVHAGVDSMYDIDEDFHFVEICIEVSFPEWNWVCYQVQRFALSAWLDLTDEAKSWLLDEMVMLLDETIKEAGLY